ncbi:MAG: NUDIX domain-containing protein [Clostridia bacterium]|nr:NUDIX domain-containing protein [Clostridia bacterium]
MKACKVFPLDTFPICKYVVIVSSYEGKLLLSRHRERSTWETQGGHIENGEPPIDAAMRELREESGAEEFTISPVCDYWAGDEKGSAVGRVYKAVIHSLGPMPDYEMAEVRVFDTLPEQLTYPWIIQDLIRVAGFQGIVS